MKLRSHVRYSIVFSIISLDVSGSICRYDIPRLLLLADVVLSPGIVILPAALHIELHHPIKSAIHFCLLEEAVLTPLCEVSYVAQDITMYPLGQIWRPHDKEGQVNQYTLTAVCAISADLKVCTYFLFV